MTPKETYEKLIVSTLKSVYDPEIPVNVYDLGVIYLIDIDDDMNVKINMTLTAPNCPMADDLVEMVRYKVSLIEGIGKVSVSIVFDPPWDTNMLSDEAKLELGLL